MHSDVWGMSSLLCIGRKSDMPLSLRLCLPMLSLVSWCWFVRLGMGTIFVWDFFLAHCSVCIIAGDVTPLDVICHLPLLCEDAAVPYVFTPRKEDLGAASCTKRPTSVVLVTAGKGKDKGLAEEAREELKACVEQVAGLRTAVSM